MNSWIVGDLEIGENKKDRVKWRNGESWFLKFCHYDVDGMINFYFTKNKLTNLLLNGKF